MDRIKVTKRKRSYVDLSSIFTKERIYNIAIIGLLAVVYIQSMIIGSKNSEIEILEYKLQRTEVELEEATLSLKELNNELCIASIVKDRYKYNFDNLYNFTVLLSNQLDKVVEKNKILNECVDNLETRISVYEKYDYALFHDTKRNDLTYDQLLLGEELMESKGYDPDLLFGMIMVESDGRENAINPSSGATGYGQFMASTGKYIYEDKLQLGKYDHNTTPKDGNINIKMMASYLDILINKYDNNIVDALKEYCGSSDYVKTYEYIDRIHNKLNNKKTVYQMVKKE